MPGIVGLITRMPSQEATTRLHAMGSVLRHEPFYESGTWIKAESGVYVGWTVRRGSFSNGMPLSSVGGDRVLVFAGEEYSAPETVASLKGRGSSPRPDGPAYLVGLSEVDPAFPAGLNGRFHGLLVDLKSRTATLFNDRFGMQRLYYYESKAAFYFAAEAKAILEVCPDLRTVDPRGLGEYVACGCVLENRSIFRGLHVLPPGSAWVFQNAELRGRESYFQPSEWENQDRLEPPAYDRQLQEVFSRNLPRYFGGAERVALSLTGGLDTRMILAWWKPPAGSLPCYTCQDVLIARRLARLCQQPFQVIPVGSEFLSRFEKYAERTVYLSDGCAPVNRAADLYVNQIASEVAPVRVTGNYGSEILRRLRAFKPVPPAPGLFSGDVLPQIDAAKRTYDGFLAEHAVSFMAFRQAPWYQYGLLSLEQTQLAVRSPYLDNDVVQTAFRAPSSALAKSDIFEDSDACSRLIAAGSPSLQAIRTDRGLGGKRAEWAPPIGRSLLEFTFRAEYAYDYGMPQWLARIDHAFAPLHLERLFLGRHKFCHYRVWYRDALGGYVRSMLLDSRALSRPYVERNALEYIVHHHLRGDRNYTTEIHQLLTLELIHRIFLDPK